MLLALLLLGFIFLVLFFTIARIGFVNYVKNFVKLEAHFDYFLATHNTTKIKDGPFVDFVVQLNKKFGTPTVNLYLFAKKENYIELQGMPEPPEASFTLLIDHRVPKFSIFLPEDWSEKLKEDEIKWLICHELGHVNNFYKERILEGYCTIKRYYKQIFSKDPVGNLFDPREKKEIWADNFAAKVVGRNRSVEILQKIDRGNNPEVAQHISNIKQARHNPLNLS